MHSSLDESSLLIKWKSLVFWSFLLQINWIKLDLNRKETFTSMQLLTEPEKQRQTLIIPQHKSSSWRQHLQMFSFVRSTIDCVTRFLSNNLILFHITSQIKQQRVWCLAEEHFNVQPGGCGFTLFCWRRLVCWPGVSWLGWLAVLTEPQNYKRLDSNNFIGPRGSRKERKEPRNQNTK